MKAAVLVSDLRARGITLVADGNHLRLRPGSALTRADLDVLRSRKADVLAILRDEPAPHSSRRLTCFACKSVRFWQSIHGVTVCATCHPPAHPDLVARWLEAGP